MFLRDRKNRKKNMEIKKMCVVWEQTHAVALTLYGRINAESQVVQRKYGSLYLHICCSDCSMISTKNLRYAGAVSVVPLCSKNIA